MPERARLRSAHDLQLWVGACVRAIADAACGRHVGSVVLGLGRDVDPARALAAWTVTADDPVFTGASLQFVPNTHVLVCLDCRHEYQGGRLARCPCCGSSELAVVPTPPVTVIKWAIVGAPSPRATDTRRRAQAQPAPGRSLARGRS